MESEAMKRHVLQFLITGFSVAIWLLVFNVFGFIQWQPRLLSTGAGESELVGVSHSETGELVYREIAQAVTPFEGLTVPVVWGDLGQRLVGAGTIDLEKFRNHYGELIPEQEQVLSGDDLQQITFTAQNIQFWTNVLWSLGLTQRSKVLGEGPIKLREAEIPIGGYASTGGWTLGSQPATELYNSTRLVELTPEQDDLVHRVAETIYRPCCGNHTAYPDCNHGMAVLGLLELMASQGATEDELYDAALAFNSFAFPDQYVVLGVYLLGQGLPWSDADAAQILSVNYSSGQAMQRIAQQVGPRQGSSEGGGCSA
jgi:hypothetical protein